MWIFFGTFYPSQDWSRSNRPEVFLRESVLRESPATILKKRLWYSCFPVNFGKLLRTPFLTEHLR